MTDNAYFETPTRMRQIFSYALSVSIISPWRRTGTSIKQHIAMDQFTFNAISIGFLYTQSESKNLMNDLTFLRV